MTTRPPPRQSRDYNDRTDLQLKDQGDHVADEVEQGVGRDVRRLLAAGVAALVGGNNPVSGRRQRPELVTPGDQLSGQPCSSRTSGPCPCSAMCSLTPFTSTKRWVSQLPTRISLKYVSACYFFFNCGYMASRSADSCDLTQRVRSSASTSWAPSSMPSRAATATSRGSALGASTPAAMSVST